MPPLDMSRGGGAKSIWVLRGEGRDKTLICQRFQ